MRNENELQLFRELTIGVENMLESMFGNNRTLYRVNFPKKNIVQLDENSYRIDFLLAGYKKDQLEIFVDENNMLNVKSAKIENEENDSEDVIFPKYLLKEVAQRAFHAKIKLIDTEVSSAKMEDGILSIFIKKKVPPENKKITVE